MPDKTPRISLADYRALVGGSPCPAPSTGTGRISTGEFRAYLASGALPLAQRNTASTESAPGRTRRRSPEEDLQRTCIAWAQLLVPRYPVLRWLIHVPNGGKRPRGEAGKLKALGTKPGVPDLLLPRRFGRWAGMAIELKSPIGTVSDEQQAWLDAFEADGYLVDVCRDLPAFRTAVARFVGDSALARRGAP